MSALLESKKLYLKRKALESECLSLFPMIFSLVVSFTDWDYTKGFGNWNFIGLKNFIDMWQDEWFTSSLFNTTVFAIVVVPTTVFHADT